MDVSEACLGCSELWPPGFPEGHPLSFDPGSTHLFWCLCPSRTQDGETALQLAIRNQLPLVVDAICTRGADMSVPDEQGNPPLWLALANNLEDIASTLVRQAQLPLHLHVGVICVRDGFGTSIVIIASRRSAK